MQKFAFSLPLLVLLGCSSRNPREVLAANAPRLRLVLSLDPHTQVNLFPHAGPNSHWQVIGDMCPGGGYGDHVDEAAQNCLDQHFAESGKVSF